MSASMLGKYKIAVDTTTIANGDSLAAYLTDAAGSLITSTLIGSKQSMDVNNPSEYVNDTASTGTDYGTLGFAQRHDANTTIATVDGNFAPLQLDATGNLKVSGTFTTSFTAEHNEDDPFTDGDSGIATLLVRQDTLATSTSADGDYGSFKSNSLGELYVHDTSVLAELTTIQGDTSSIATSSSTTASNTTSIAASNTTIATNTGNTATSVASIDGKLTDYGTSLSVSDVANSSILQQQVSVTSTAAPVPATALTLRKSLMLQNTSSNKMWIGSATVTTSGATAGIELPANSFMELEVGASVPVYAIKSGAGSLTLNVLEMA